MRQVTSILMSIALILCLSISLHAQWATDKNAREDAKYARVLQGTEEITVDGVEESIWAKADSVVVGYGQTKYLPGSGYDMWQGPSVAGDSANAVVKFLYKKPYVYLLFKVQDKYVGGRDWSQFDAIIIAFKENLPVEEGASLHYWIQPWDKRLEHFYTWGYYWAYKDSFPDYNALVGASPIFMGTPKVAGGKEEWRTDAQKERWTAVTVVNGTSMDSLPDVGWVSEHRMRVDSMGFNPDGDVLPFSFSLFDADGYLDSSETNNSHTRTWWNTPWNENWYYGALYVDPNVTTTSPAGLIPPVDYTIPRLRNNDAITIDGDLSEWKMDNVLHFRAKWNDEAGFDSIKGTGKWASGFSENELNDRPTVVNGPEVDYYVTYDNENMYVGAKVSDEIVTIPLFVEGKGTYFDGISFFMVPRAYRNGEGIFPAKELAVNIDSLGEGVAAADLIGLSDTAGVLFKALLHTNTNVDDIIEIDSGFSVELKIPFATFSYPANLGDSVVFIGGEVHDVDVFEDANSNYSASAWWFKQTVGQKSPAWVVLGPAKGAVDVKDNVQIPTSIELFDNYPNPFNPTTTIQFSTNVTSDVTLSVYNLLGQLVTEMKKSNVPAGFDKFEFNAKGLSSGVYFYQLRVKNATSGQIVDSKVKKMVLLK